MGTKRHVRPKPASRTNDVLGQSRAEIAIPPKWQKHYTRLMQLHDQLLNRRENLAKDALEEQPTFSSHMADAASDAFDRDFALGLLSSEQDALYEVEQALQRIRTDSFGICELTGKPIERARLDAIPWTRFRVEAGKQLEQEGAIKRPHLGPRDSIVREEPGAEPEED